MAMRRIAIILGTVLLGTTLYVGWINRDSMEMTTRQKLLRAFYPAFTGIQRLFGGNTQVHQPGKPVAAPQSFYTLSLKMIDGSTRSMADFKGKKVLLVNTASDCGYTAQYADLQALHERMGEKLVIIGVPANDFKEQEKGDDASIAAFCKRNYGVSFPIASKATVVKGVDQHPVFQWLSNPALNGWNDRAPSWNFMKYLVDEEGNLKAVLEPAVNPAGELLQGLLTP